MAKPSYPTILYLEGVDSVLKNVNRASMKMAKAAEKGLLTAGAHLRNESLKIVPVQMGNLAASAYAPRNVGGKGFMADVVVGYTAEYAVWVHEIPNPPHAHGKEFNVKHAAEIAAAKGTAKGTAKGGMFNRRPDEQWKFLEKPMRTERRNILQIIRNYIKAVKK